MPCLETENCRRGIWLLLRCCCLPLALLPRSWSGRGGVVRIEEEQQEGAPESAAEGSTTVRRSAVPRVVDDSYQLLRINHPLREYEEVLVAWPQGIERTKFEELAEQQLAKAEADIAMLARSSFEVPSWYEFDHVANERFLSAITDYLASCEGEDSQLLRSSVAADELPPSVMLRQKIRELLAEDAWPKIHFATTPAESAQYLGLSPLRIDIRQLRAPSGEIVYSTSRFYWELFSVTETRDGIPLQMLGEFPYRGNAESGPSATERPVVVAHVWLWYLLISGSGDSWGNVMMNVNPLPAAMAYIAYDWSSGEQLDSDAVERRFWNGELPIRAERPLPKALENLLDAIYLSEENRDKSPLEMPGVSLLGFPGG